MTMKQRRLKDTVEKVGFQQISLSRLSSLCCSGILVGDNGSPSFPFFFFFFFFRCTRFAHKRISNSTFFFFFFFLPSFSFSRCDEAQLTENRGAPGGELGENSFFLKKKRDRFFCFLKSLSALRPLTLFFFSFSVPWGMQECGKKKHGVFFFFFFVSCRGVFFLFVFFSIPPKAFFFFKEN